MCIFMCAVCGCVPVHVSELYVVSAVVWTGQGECARSGGDGGSCLHLYVSPSSALHFLPSLVPLVKQVVT